MQSGRSGCSCACMYLASVVRRCLASVAAAPAQSCLSCWEPWCSRLAGDVRTRSARQRVRVSRVLSKAPRPQQLGLAVVQQPALAAAHRSPDLQLAAAPSRSRHATRAPAAHISASRAPRGQSHCARALRHLFARRALLECARPQPEAGRQAPKPGRRTRPQPAPSCRAPPRASLPHGCRHLLSPSRLSTSAMPALLVDTRPPSTSPGSASTPPEQRTHRRSQSRSPNRPPVSPITPTVAAAQLVRPEPSDARPRVAPPQPPPTATFRQQPASVPISESENPDAIALRSAISLLQLQREKSRRDLKALEELKAAAVSDPHAFVRSLQEQRKDAAGKPTDVLTPTLSDIAEAAAREGAEYTHGQGGTVRKDSAAVEGSLKDATKFPAIPQPQNIVRCPPVNWAKYHIVGEPLDKLHAEQKRYPGSSEPPRTHQGAKAPPHRVAAPYSPFTDGIGGPPTAQPWRGPKKSKSPS
jgi:hypothetical protein